MSMNNDRISRSIVPAGDLVQMLLLLRCQSTAMLTWAIYNTGVLLGKFLWQFLQAIFVNEDSFRNVKDFEQDSEKNVTWLTLFNGKTFHQLQWCYNGCDGVSNHQSHDCLLNRLFRRKSKKTPKLHVAGLCEGNSHVTGEFPAQKACNAEMFLFDDVIMHIQCKCL